MTFHTKYLKMWKPFPFSHEMPIHHTFSTHSSNLCDRLWWPTHQTQLKYKPKYQMVSDRLNMHFSSQFMVRGVVVAPIAGLASSFLSLRVVAWTLLSLVEPVLTLFLTS